MSTELEIPSTMHIESVEGVNTPPDNQPEGEIHNPNKEIMDAIYEKRKARLLAEEATQLGEEIKVLDPVPEPEPIIDPIPIEPPVIPEAKLPEKVSLKVEGKDIEVPMDTLITLAQKGMSADQRFQEAANQRQEAQRLMFAMQNTQQPTAQPAPQPKDNFANIIPDIAKRINYGSEEEQHKALLDYGAAIEAKFRDENKSLPQEQLVHVATQNAISAIKFEQDQDTISKEFPEVFKDKHLSLLAGNIAGEKKLEAENHYRQTGVLKPLVDIWRESLAEVKSKYIPVQSAPPVQAVPKIVVENDKIERKRAAPQPLVAANKTATETPPKHGVDPSSVVARMRKARGQPDN